MVEVEMNASPTRIAGRPAPASGRPTVLVVDDDLLMTRLIARTLDAAARVLAANNGQDGFRLAVSERPDLIVLDWILPDLRGDVVCQRVRACDALEGVKVVILTAHGRAFTAPDARAAGADAFLAKPFSPLAFHDLVTRLLVP